jgi:DNA-binding NarL/FixJ family response regulator
MPRSEHLRVLLVDDHAVVRTGLKLLLEREQDIVVVGEAGTALGCVVAHRVLQPDVVVMDIVLPDESGILRLLALGHTNQEIAYLLTISVRTAETHRAHIMRKLRLQTRADLVRHALTTGLLTDAA